MLIETHQLDTSESKSIDECHLIPAVSNNCCKDSRLVCSGMNAVAIQWCILGTWRYVDHMKLTAASIPTQWDLHNSKTRLPNSHVHTQTHYAMVNQISWSLFCISQFVVCIKYTLLFINYYAAEVENKANRYVHESVNNKYITCT